MTLDVVNAANEKVGSVEIADEIASGPVNTGLIWESVVHTNAVRRRGTHATKNRALVSGSGRKPWRQKGTGRARVGEIRNPLWRKGGTVFGPQPRSYAYRLPRQVAVGALRAAFRQCLAERAITVVEALPSEAKTRGAVEFLRALSAARPAVVVDVRPSPAVERAFRNLSRVRLVSTVRLTARDLMTARCVVVTRPAVEALGRALAGGARVAGNQA